MLTEEIMHDCINRLLKEEKDQGMDEENLECLCKLLTTIGQALDKSASQKSVKSMKEHFDRLEKIIGKKKGSSAANISSRIRFMILDVVELRQVCGF